MRIWATSDLHGWLPPAPSPHDVDLAVIAGDICTDFIGTIPQVRTSQLGWLEKTAIPWLNTFPGDLPIVFIWGNHDFVGERADLVKELPWPGNVIPLNDHWVEVNGLRVYGSPWSISPKGWAFNATEEEVRDRVWGNAPEKVDILVTHGPPAGPAGLTHTGNQFGYRFLDDWVRRERVKTVICGHIHEAKGIYEATAGRPYLTVNAARCDLKNKPVMNAVVFDTTDSQVPVPALV